MNDKIALIVTMLVIAVSPAANGQKAQTGQTPASTTPPSVAIQIPDVPLAIDPATLIAPELAATATTSFTDTSLSDVATWIQSQTSIPVILDRRSLEAAGVLASEPVNDRINDEPIYLVLDRLSGIGVDWRLNNGVIYLHSVDDENVYTRQYNIGDLLDAKYKADSLTWTIENCVETDSWEVSGGVGGIILLGDVMFVRQSNYVHRRVAGLLSALRTHGRRTLIFQPPQHQQLREALATEISVRFNEMPLELVASQLSNLAKADIRLDTQSLAGAGVRRRMPIEMELEKQPLRLALDLISQHYELAWQLKDGVLWITTPESVHLVTAVFDVRDLCRDTIEAEALLEAIQSQTDPESWDSYGGEGTIEFPQSGTMVVRHSGRGQDEVLQLLETYRTALRGSKPRADVDANPKQTFYYRMPSNVANDLVAMLPELVGGGSWKSNENPEGVGTLRLVESWAEVFGQAKGDAKKGETQSGWVVPHSILVIQQRRDVHEQITKLLGKLQHGDVPVMDHGGGMGGGGMGGGGFGGGFFRVPSETRAWATPELEK